MVCTDGTLLAALENILDKVFVTTSPVLSAFDSQTYPLPYEPLGDGDGYVVVASIALENLI